MTRVLVLLVVLALVLTGCAGKSTKPDWRAVRLVTDAAAVKDCTLLTVLRDDDMDDMRKRAAKRGADTVLVTGATGVDIPMLSKIKHTANIYQCGAGS